MKPVTEALAKLAAVEAALGAAARTIKGGLAFGLLAIVEDRVRVCREALETPEPLRYYRDKERLDAEAEIDAMLKRLGE